MPPFYLEFRGLIISITFNNPSVYKLISLFNRNATRKQCYFKTSDRKGQRRAIEYCPSCRSCGSEQDHRSSCCWVFCWPSSSREGSAFSLARWSQAAGIKCFNSPGRRHPSLLHLQELWRDQHDLLRQMQRVVPLLMHGNLSSKYTKTKPIFYLFLVVTQLFVI